MARLRRRRLGQGIQQETGTDVDVVFVGTDDEIWAKIKGSEGKDFDVLAVNTAQLQRYIDAGLVTPHDLDKLPNQKETCRAFATSPRSGHDPRRQGLRHSVRFRHRSASSTTPTKVKSPPTSWEVFSGRIQGPILVYDNGEHNFSFTALTMGIADPFHLSPSRCRGEGKNWST